MRALAIISTIITPATAFAASGRTDNSGIFVWGFLGFCALIVVAQALPAILMMIGAAHSFKGTGRAAAQVKS